MIGKPQLVHDEDFATGKPPARLSLAERSGPILSVLGLLGWAVVAVLIRLIWKDYNPDFDVMGVNLFAGGIASAVVVLVGGAISVTMSGIGLLISASLIPRRAYIPAAIGMIAGVLGLAPLIFVAVMSLT